ncbi:MM3350-like domain-containing protein [Cerioporus squamosus]|nr:MM3350-like domain-containing protein [Cerioporus squamosus]
MSQIAPGSPCRFTPRGEYKKPAFVKFDPEDDGSNLDEIFWEDPLTFTPRRCRNGYVENWGLYPMTTQFIYDRKTKIRPEEQFVNALMDKKVKQLAQVDLGDLPRRDYTLYVAIPFLEHPTDTSAHRYWRRIRVSGGLPLGVFADKVLTPVWGWVRNLHAHTFQDLKDGAQFGPKDCNSIDLMTWMDNAGYAYIPEESYCIAHILRAPGDVMLYHYDFGDKWFVDIKLEEIAPAESSTGTVAVLAGRGGRLPDGSSTGTWSWRECLQEADASSGKDNYKGKHDAVNALFDASNFKDRQKPSDPLLYSFDEFDIEECRAEVQNALDSKASLSHASKKFVVPVGEGRLETLLQPNEISSRIGIKMKKGNVVVQTPTGSRGQFMEEGVRATRKDNPTATACAQCGSPHGLRACSRCGQRFYCGRECQATHWKKKHKSECKNAKK